MMEVIVNNKSVQTQAVTIEELAAEMNLPSQGVAVAIDNKMVPRAEWSSISLVDGQKLTILKAFCGG